MKRIVILAVIFAACTHPAQVAVKGWKDTVKEQLPVMGHRNWILVVDKAFPGQTTPGIRTVHTGASMPEVLAFVQEQLATSPHVKPIVYRDAELAFITDSLSPGIAAAEKEVARAIGRLPVNTIPHEQVFGKMSAAAGMFTVLVLKTESLHPYTSVFLELDCAYWNGAKEQQLRAKMNL